MTRPAVVLLPGLLCDRAVWEAQREALDFADCTVPSYEPRTSLAAMAADVLAAVKAERFALAGHSMGARVALEIMRAAPERVERLALLDTGLDALASGLAGEREHEQRFALLATARRDGMRAMAEQWARGMVHPDHLTLPVFQAVIDMVSRSTPPIFEAQIRALLSRPNARDVLAAVRCPTLIACGRQDGWSPLARHEEMHRIVPAARLVVIEDSGHMAPMEQPAAVSAALCTWLEESA